MCILTWTRCSSLLSLKFGHGVGNTAFSCETWEPQAETESLESSMKAFPKKVEQGDKFALFFAPPYLRLVPQESLRKPAGQMSGNATIRPNEEG
jgi:hypothetical protein